MNTFQGTNRKSSPPAYHMTVSLPLVSRFLHSCLDSISFLNALKPTERANSEWTRAGFKNFRWWNKPKPKVPTLLFRSNMQNPCYYQLKRKKKFYFRKGLTSGKAGVTVNSKNRKPKRYMRWLHLRKSSESLH